MLKYKMLKHDKINLDGTTLYRIKACKEFKTITGRIIHKGEKGGYIEKESNLSQEGSCWVSDNACVSGNAWVNGNACVSEFAQVHNETAIYGNAIVSGNAYISGKSCIFDNARIFDFAEINNSCISENAWIGGTVKVYNGASVYGENCFCGNEQISGYTNIIELQISQKDEPDICD